MKILQINLNRSRSAHDLALVTAKELNTDILIISEPNRKAINEKRGWISDDETDAAIKVLNAELIIEEQGKGLGFSYISMPDLIIYSCYMSPNRDIEEFEETLNQIEQQLRRNRKKTIIAGDFNAKSPLWGTKTTDRRGEIVGDWIAQNNLAVVNKGEEPTFQRRDCTSIIDITLATTDAICLITHWEVSHKESLSDHKYIMFEVTEKGPKMRATRKVQKGWQTKKINNENLEKAINEIQTNEVIGSAEGFSKGLQEICNKCMPKKRSITTRPPVYWWSAEIAAIRKACIRKRRDYQRSVGRKSSEERQDIWREYKEEKKRLTVAIKKSKRVSWKQICDKVDCDIWGDGYKIVMKMVGGFPPMTPMTMEMTEKVVDHLFPVHEQVKWNCDKTVIFSRFTIDELCVACDNLKSNKAPGPGNIPPNIIKHLATTKPELVLQVYNKLASKAIFPVLWKRANLLLLRKGDKPINDPASFRPICLLDVEGKLYEQLVLIRLNKEIDRTGGLSKRQYGFRRGRQTVDAILEVINTAKDAALYTSNHRRLCAMLTLDVRNAFNSASWQHILDALRQRGIDESIINIVSSYLSDRLIILEAQGVAKTKTINSGIPQGSILGPTLWNILYNDLLETEFTQGTKLIGFADDIAMVVVAKTEQELMNKANSSLIRVGKWLTAKGLQLAPQKTEAVLLTTKRKMSRIEFSVQGNTVYPKKYLKYLGVWLDNKLTYAEHTSRSIQKAGKTVTALARLLPNIGGARASRRMVLASVIHSQLLYAAPVWHSVTNNAKLTKRLSRIQRYMTVRVASAYRTISFEAAAVITGIPPIKLLTLERVERYNGVNEKDAKDNLMQRWQQDWNVGTKGRWTRRLIPEIKKWIDRSYGEVDYFLTQALSGHGCFRKYLFERKRSDTSKCPYCDLPDDAEHTLFECRKWENERIQYNLRTQMTFTVETLVENLISSKEAWNKTYKLIRQIIETKETEERIKT